MPANRKTRMSTDDRCHTQGRQQKTKAELTEITCPCWSTTSVPKLPGISAIFCATLSLSIAPLSWQEPRWLEKDKTKDAPQNNDTPEHQLWNIDDPSPWGHLHRGRNTRKSTKRKRHTGCVVVERRQRTQWLRQDAATCFGPMYPTGVPKRAAIFQSGKNTRKPCTRSLLDWQSINFYKVYPPSMVELSSCKKKVGRERSENENERNSFEPLLCWWSITAQRPAPQISWPRIFI